MKFFKSHYRKKLDQALFEPEKGIMPVLDPDCRLRTADDVRYVAKLLEQIESGKLDGRADCWFMSRFTLLTNQLQRIGSDEAAIAFAQYAILVVLRLFDSRCDSQDPVDQQEAYALLEILAMVPGDLPLCAERVVQGIRNSLACDEDTWEMTFETIAGNEELAEAVCREVGKEIPSGKLTIPYLRLASQLYRDAKISVHPIDGRRGYELLDELLSAPSLPNSWFEIAECLPEYQGTARNDLISRAIVHEHPSFRLVASKALAADGGGRGIQMLQEFCFDQLRSSLAQDYLKQLGLAHLIPPETTRTEFQAE